MITQFPLINIHHDKKLENVSKFDQQPRNNLHQLYKNYTIAPDFCQLLIQLFLGEYLGLWGKGIDGLELG